MHDQATTGDTDSRQEPRDRDLRSSLRNQALQNGLRKLQDGVPTLSVSEAAPLFSISQEYLYRLVQAGAFPALRLRLGTGQGRYVIPTAAIKRLLQDASTAGDCLDVDGWTEQWHSQARGGAAR